MTDKQGDYMARTMPGKTRQQIYHYMRQRLQVGHPPTMREVQAYFGFRSVQSVRAHLQQLEQEGLLVRRPGVSRGYSLPDSGGSWLKIPLLGQVQAGQPMTAIQEIEGYLPILSHYPQSEMFALRVQGQSMTGAGILPGDILVVHQQSVADNGNIVVALLDDEATVKTYSRNKNVITLTPANPDFAPQTFVASDIVLLGKVVELRRSYNLEKIVAN